MLGEQKSSNLFQTMSSGESPADEGNTYLSRLILDLSRSKAELQRQIDAMKEERDAAMKERDQLKDEKLDMISEIDAYNREFYKTDSKVKEYEEKLLEISSLRENLTKGEAERSDLMRRIGEAEDQNSLMREELANVSLLKEQLLAELESARRLNAELLEQQTNQKQDTDIYPPDSGSLRSLTEELEKTIEDVKSESISVEDALEEDFISDDNSVQDASDQPFYNTELMTNSGYDLLALLQNMSEAAQENGSSVQISKSWEEESEEITTDPNRENGQIVKKIRKKTEVSVKYLNGE